ncbi:MAG TPA: DUF2793 domain-containing protein [Hyphomonadaceae bacterium]|nr:DUF2793 domain-containing protein [Hyphomonadaceae bacterium]
MSNTTNLLLPYLAVGQAQKHVTVNETLRKLDAIVQLSVTSASTASQPASPVDGAVYIIPAGKTGADWSAFANDSLGYYRDGAWVEITPREGWLAYVKDTDQLVAYSGSAWVGFPAAKILTVSATDKLLGRASSGAGAAEEVACTAAGRALIDDADASAQRTTLGLGTAATQNTGTSGANVPLLNGANAWSGAQTVNAQLVGKGTATNDNASAGYLGEIVASTVVVGSQVSLTSAAVANITSISLTAGDWDVSLLGIFNFGSTTSITRLFANISQVSATLDATPGAYADFTTAAMVPGAGVSGGLITLAVPPYRVSLASTTTIYAVALANFTVSTCAVYGRLAARRVR